MEKYFVNSVVIGGGASGMLCSISMAQKNPNKKILLIEKEQRLGRKLSATGNGRCNLSNLNIDQTCYCGTFQDGVNNILQKYPPQILLDKFADLGLLCDNDSEGRVYPYSRHCASVVDTLENAINRHAVQVLYNTKVIDIKKEKRKFTITCNDTVIISDNVVVCAGGRSYSALGSDGSLFKIIKSLGHTVTQLSPSLCPLMSNDRVLTTLKGVRARAKVTLLDDDIAIKSEVGEVQFTANSLSGICVFDLSRYFKNLKKPYVSVDLLPNSSIKEIFSLLNRNRGLFSGDNSPKIFTGIFHNNISQAIITKAGKPSKLCNELTDGDLYDIAKVIKNLKFHITNTADFENSQVTSGGVLGSEINSDTFESKIIKGLYFCGEVIDVDGKCGGYNLHFAFASALNVGEKL